MSSIYNWLTGGDEEAAAKAAQQGVNAFNGVATPTVASLQYTPTQQQASGQEQVGQATGARTGPSAFNSIQTNPALQQAGLTALSQLQQTASNGGLNATDKAALQDVAQREAEQNAGQQGAILQGAAARGGANSGAVLPRPERDFQWAF